MSAPAYKAHGPASVHDSEEPLPLLVVHLRGSQAEMGAQHGQILLKHGGWQRAIAYYPHMVEQMLRGSSLRPADRAMPAIAKPLLQSLAKRLYKDRPAELHERSLAFLQALGVEESHVVHVLAMDMFQNAVGLAGRHLLGPFGDPWIRRGVPACSTLMAWGAATSDGQLLHGRNFDFPGVGVWDMAPELVFCSPTGGMNYGFATCRGADVAAISAFNEAGLAITPHTRLHKDVAFAGAAIADLCHDIARRAETIADAEKIARERQVASTWGLAVSSARDGKAAVIEAHAKNVAVTWAEPGSPWKTCTNHYLAADLRHRELAPAPGWTWHTHSRKKRLEQAATQAVAGAKLTPAELFAWLGDRRDADTPEVERAAGGVVAQSTGVHSVVLEPQARRIHVSAGRCPTGRGTIQTVSWDWSQPVGGQVAPTSATPAPVSPSAYDAGGPRHQAYRHYLRAAQLEAQGGLPGQVDAELEAACQSAPDDPTFLLLGGAVALRRKDLAEAYRRFDRGAALEVSPFAKGRLHLWAMRAARHLPNRDPAYRDHEERHRAALLQLDHPLLGVLHGQARHERDKPWSKRRLGNCPLHTLLGDIG